MDTTAKPALRAALRLLSGLVDARGGPSARALRDAVADKVVLVTGASYGIGEATARRLGAAGATVLLVARSRDRLEGVAAAIAEHGGGAYAYPTDLADPDAVAALAATILERHGHVDVVV